MNEVVRQDDGEPSSATVSGVVNEARAQGMGQGWVMGWAEGLDKGVLKGRAQGMAVFLLKQLDRRGVPLSTAQRERIELCRDEPLLNEWFDRAATVTTSAQLFAGYVGSMAGRRRGISVIGPGQTVREYTSSHRACRASRAGMSGRPWSMARASSA